MTSEKPLIFVSCGQYTENERQLGKDICSLLTTVRPDVTAYFAENQSTVEGLSNELLMALYRAAGFICVMHRRGDLYVPGGRTVTRGSVWIEQEIAIVAFINHVLGRSVPTLYYKETGISLEGIRSVLLMNPRIEFATESEVLKDLTSALPSIAFVPHNSYDLVPALSYRRIANRSNADHHVYELTADVRNVGSDRITDFEIRIYFPRAFLNPSTSWGAEDRRRSTPSHICFSANATGRASGGLYPGDGAVNPLTIEYFVDDALDDNPDAMRSEVIVELFSGSMKPKRETRQMRELQDF